MDRDFVARSWSERGFSFGLWVDPPGQVWTDYVHDVEELVVDARLTPNLLRARLQAELGDWDTGGTDQGGRTAIP